MAFHAYQFNFRQVKACVTTWRKPRRRWTEKKDWEDQAHVATFGDAPAKWTVYCVQFPRSRTFHLDTAAWNCHTRVDIPWQQLPQPVVFTAAPIPFCCTNPNCIWFAVPYGPKGQYLICHRFIGTFLYDAPPKTSALCVSCLVLSNKPRAMYIQPLVLILNYTVACSLTMKVMLSSLLRTTGGLMTLQGTKHVLLKHRLTTVSSSTQSILTIFHISTPLERSVRNSHVTGTRTMPPRILLILFVP